METDQPIRIGRYEMKKNIPNSPIKKNGKRRSRLNTTNKPSNMTIEEYDSINT